MCTIMPMPGSKEATLELLKARFSGVSVYGLLLNSDPKHPIAQVVHEHWSEIHNLTGSEIALVAFDPPLEWTDTLKDYWKKELGSSFDQIWQGWQKPPDVGLALSYLDLFPQQEIKAVDLPCLVLFTELDKPQAVVRSLPAWAPEKLYHLLLSIFDDVRYCCTNPKDSRLECLRRKLNSPSATALAYLAHYAEEIGDYVRKHPAQIVSTSVTFVLALTTNNVVPLGAGIVGILQAVRSSLPKS